MRGVRDWLIEDCMIGDNLTIMRCTSGRILLVNYSALNRWREEGSGPVQLDNGPYCFLIEDKNDRENESTES